MVSLAAPLCPRCGHPLIPPHGTPQQGSPAIVIQQTQNAPVVVAPLKSIGIAILLTFLFGPLGMFYSTIAGGLVMLLVSIVVAAVTLGFGLIFTYPICIIWGAVAASSYNDRILRR